MKSIGKSAIAIALVGIANNEAMVSATKLQATTQTATKAHAKVETKVETKAKVESKTESKAKTETKAESKTKAKGKNKEKSKTNSEYFGQWQQFNQFDSQLNNEIDMGRRMAQQMPVQQQ